MTSTVSAHVDAEVEIDEETFNAVAAEHYWRNPDQFGELIVEILWRGNAEDAKLYAQKAGAALRGYDDVPPVLRSIAYYGEKANA